MLVNGSKLLSTPVMSLHMGGKVAVTKRPVIHPGNLRVIAYEVTLTSTPLPHFLLTSDIREYGPLGMIVDDSDEFVVDGDVLRLDEIRALNFPLVGMQVKDEDGKKLGKVADYTVDTLQFEIQQLSIQRGLFQSFTDTGALIHRSQIVEINDTAITVKSTKLKSAQPIVTQERAPFVNPFRSPGQSPQPDSSSTTSL